MTRKRFAIEVPAYIYEALVKKKDQLGMLTWESFFAYLLKLVDQELEKRVKQLLCNELRRTRLSLPDWGIILYGELKDPDAVAKALGYLKQDPSTGLYVVNTEKC
jgi:hypothetical protein